MILSLVLLSTPVTLRDPPGQDLVSIFSQKAHLLDSLRHHMGAGRSEVDVEHDDTYHHNHGDQDHAEKQEPENTHRAWSWGLRAEA